MKYHHHQIEVEYQLETDAFKLVADIYEEFENNCKNNVFCDVYVR
jgi:hypothetical protein